jgi:hypothetical protein
MGLADLDARALYLQVNALERSTSKSYATGARDYINFCILHSLPLDPTPTTLSRYIAFSSQFIASAPKYLTGVVHFLKELYPEFDDSRSHPLVKSTIRGSKKCEQTPYIGSFLGAWLTCSRLLMSWIVQVRSTTC